MRALEELARWWALLPTIDQRSKNNANMLVTSCEEVIRNEFQSWCSSLQAVTKPKAEKEGEVKQLTKEKDAVKV